MPEDVALVCATAGCTVRQGTEILARAEALRVDPFDFIRIRLGLDEALIYERAARWSTLAFSAIVPDIGRLPGRLARIGELAQVRSLRLELFDREILFVAPRFRQFLALSGQSHANPETRRRVCIVPPGELRRALRSRSKAELVDYSRQNLSRVWPFATAHLDLGLAVRLGFIAVLSALLLVAVLAPFWARPVLVPLLFVLLVPPSWFRIAAIIDATDPRGVNGRDLADDAALPVYSVLVPLRDEAHMVPQLLQAFRRLDYPAEKLDIKFIVEADSPETVAAVRRGIGTSGFELIIVPRAQPFTKPKALNYVLPLARGDFVVIYDAEDKPEPEQLRRTASLFLSDPALGCIQAELVPENAGENALTALFASEYGGQFGIMLPGLVRWGFPMPLGGTSNHFRAAILRQIGGWDAFNVTEDADLGLRLARRRIRTATIAARTYEEAPVTTLSWFHQRTRWMKGWMQTFLVHNRRPLSLLRDLGLANFLALEIYVGGMILTPPLHTLFMAAVVVRLFLTSLEMPGADPWSFIAAFTLVIGYLSAVGLSVFGLIRLKRARLIRYQLLLPLYWALMGLASFKAGYELIFKPYFWAKTSHGVSRMLRSGEMPGRAAAHRETARPDRRDVERVKGIEPSS